MPPRRLPRPAVLLWSGLLLVGLSACSAEPGTGTDDALASVGAPGGSELSAEGDVGPIGGAGPAQEVEESRRTALVRASERVSPAVVSVNVLRTERARPRTMWESFFLPPGAQRRTPGLGSGFIYDARGLILTNEHVVRGADRILVTLPDGRDLEAELVGADEVTDIAVLRIPEGEGELPVAPVGTSRGLYIGEWTVAIGNPFGTHISNPEPSVTAGVVSAVDRHIVPSGEDRGIYLGMIQTDASINPGNSGGPLVNARGQVVGVNSSIFTRGGGSEGLGFAIPIDRAVRIASDLVRHGEVRRAWVGLDVEPVEADPWGRTRGVRIARVAPESPGARSGLRSGDRILEADGRRLAGPLDFEAVLLDLRAGEALALRIEGREDPVRLTAERLPSVRAERIRVLEEMELVTVTPEVRAERGIQNEAGALIVSIADELRSQLGLRPGDVLLQINNVPIRSAGDAADVFRRLAGGGTVRIYFERGGGVGVRTFHWRR